MWIVRWSKYWHRSMLENLLGLINCSYVCAGIEHCVVRPSKNKKNFCLVTRHCMYVYAQQIAMVNIFSACLVIFTPL